MASVQTPQAIDIGSIDASDIGAKVKVTGNISSIFSSEEASFYSIKDGKDSIEAVAFNSMPDIQGFSTVTGRVDLYQGELQLIIDDAGPKFERPVRQ